MNTNDLTYLLNKPESIRSRQTVELEAMLHQFPYFQAARAILLKGLYDENSYRYNHELKKTAAYTTDRSILFEFITSTNFRAIQQAFFEEKEAAIQNIITDHYKVVIPETQKPEPPVNETVQPETDPLEQSIRSSVTVTETEPEVQSQPEPIVSETIQAETEPEVQSQPEQIVNETAQAEIDPLEQSIRSSIAVAETEIQPEQTLNEMAQSKIDLLEQSIRSSIKVAETEVQNQPEQAVNETAEMETAAEKLEIGKPLEFSKQEKHSFQEWLQLAKLNPIDREKPVEKEEIDPEKKKKLDLIDKFIEANPKIIPSKNAPATPVNIEKSNQDNSYLMTETLAKVYLEQKKYQKAIQAYEILILKYPEKSHFFADRISDIKILQQNNN